MLTSASPLSCSTERTVRCRQSRNSPIFLIFAVQSGSVLPDSVAFTGEGKLVREATGYEQEKLKPRYPTSGARVARAELPPPIGAYR
jgi:hypothetical protein